MALFFGKSAKSTDVKEMSAKEAILSTLTPRGFDTGELSSDVIPPNFTDPDVLFDILVKTVSSYHPSSDLDMINRAYELAKKAHEGQKRRSGEPYLTHPVCVAIILAQLEMDKETIVGGLLHDVVEV